MPGGKGSMDDKDAINVASTNQVNYYDTASIDIG